MRQIIEAVRRHAASSPLKVALQDEYSSIDYAQLPGEIARLAERLRQDRPRVVAILADNGVAWALADLAAGFAGIPCIPLPLFFSSTQLAHVLAHAGVDQVLTDQPARLEAALPNAAFPARHFYGDLQRLRLPHAGGISLPADALKVTYTSGTTGDPKGVCLAGEALQTVAAALAAASAAGPDDRHLCLLPLATLLENVAGIYAPLLAGATTCLPRLASVGLSGSSALDDERMIAALRDWQASTAIMVPQMLQAMVVAARAATPMPARLRYLAVGGAPVALSLLERAAALGLPVYQGYGLSECASVVALNRPGDSRAGSVGKPLPHLRVDFADDGEILVRGLRWHGYLGDRAAAQNDDVIATGDLGHLDADGYLFLTGRKKNVFITAFGRNIAPEWVEGELTAQAGIAQAAIFGEARPFNSAVIVARADISPAAIDAALGEANRRLPDYAQVRAWVRASEAFTPGNGMSTANGRLRRSEILGKYAARIDALYQCQ